ncbi:hypothetical protein DSL72_004925 [Monilinia vaccinii-corymbosi]|uniref:Mannosyltransferase n=1 Tax=Monilinia vaccinii-corymbosi TaxID=61207 RepID=A0A8A3P0F9_9HELO|nr:hypothetical protein DSL72_004925 [Monilinia vaccinii-corymbosi]
MPVHDPINGSEFLSSLGDSQEILISFDGDINTSSPRDMNEIQSISQSPSFKNSSSSPSSSSSSSSSKDSLTPQEFDSLFSSNLGISNGSNMLVVESITVLATACILYLLSTRWKSHTCPLQHKSPKKSSSSSSSSSSSNTTRSILANPLFHISRLFTCSTLSTSTSTSSPTPTPPKQIEAGPQKPPYVLPPLKPTSPHPTSMGLKRLEKSNWLTIDHTYLHEHTIRASLLETQHPCVIQVLPVALEATHELLALVIEFLLQRYPDHFTLISPSKILNKLTGEEHVIGRGCQGPLETAARLCMEDFNILLQDPSASDPEEWKLMASATLFPAGWKLQERIGSSMAVLHAPVPGWKDNLGKSVNRYFTHLTPRTCMERSNLFIQSTPILFQDAPEPTRPNASHPAPLTPSDIYVRRERQTFTRLEKSGAVLFTVRTYMEKLIELPISEAEALAKQLRGWEANMARYKGIENWGVATLGYCDEVVEERERERSKRRDSGIDMGADEEEEEEKEGCC